MIEARIVADSVNPVGCRLTTFVVTYPRVILAEVNTHRALSRSSASSRAIPVSRMLEKIRSDPYRPIHWGKNQSGMQADQELDATTKRVAVSIWDSALNSALHWAEEMTKVGVHKQVANRLLEPFAHVTTILSATDWGNFFNLRAHKDAMPEFQELAYRMLEAYVASSPRRLAVGEWHLPFTDQYLTEGLSPEQLRKISTARCARVSYLNFEGEIDHAKDYRLHDDLWVAPHASPFEHPAECLGTNQRFGNFAGFLQYRKMLPNENREAFDPVELLSKRKQCAPA
jgi:hypothetical protein